MALRLGEFLDGGKRCRQFIKLKKEKVVTTNADLVTDELIVCVFFSMLS